MSKPRFPTGWDEKRVADLIDHYEKQTEDEADLRCLDGVPGQDAGTQAVPDEGEHSLVPHPAGDTGDTGDGDVVRDSVEGLLQRSRSTATR